MMGEVSMVIAVNAGPPRGFFAISFFANSNMEMAQTRILDDFKIEDSTGRAWDTLDSQARFVVSARNGGGQRFWGLGQNLTPRSKKPT